MDFYYTIPTLQVRPGMLVCYDYRPNVTRRKKLFGSDLKVAPTDNSKYTGLVTKKMSKNLSRAISWLVASAPVKLVEDEARKMVYDFRLNFITLTLSGPQYDVSDKIIKAKMLAPWLRKMKSVYGAFSYIWRAERQKNGRLHFHITSDCWMHWSKVRDVWNEQQAKFHFIEYFRANNDSMWPNSTDVHAVYNIDNFEAYLTKYMSKSDPDAQKIEGRLWDCSPNLKGIVPPTYAMGKREFAYVNELLKTHDTRQDPEGRCIMIFLDRKDYKSEMLPDHLRDFNEVIDRVANHKTFEKVAPIDTKKTKEQPKTTEKTEIEKKSNVQLNLNF